MKKTIIAAVAMFLGLSGVICAGAAENRAISGAGLSIQDIETPAPVSARADSEKGARPAYAALIGEYALEKAEAGNCYGRIEIIAEDFLGTLPGKSLGIYGLPAGEGLIVAQVPDINAGLRYDRYENPMVIIPGTSGFMGYRPREATFTGAKLVSKTGELSALRPGSIKKGEIVEAELTGDGLKVRAGIFSGDKVSFRDVCSYRASAAKKSLAKAVGAIYPGSRVIDTSFYVGTVREVFANGLVTVVFDARPDIVQSRHTASLAAGITSFQGIGAGTRVVDTSYYSGTVKEVFANGVAKVLFDSRPDIFQFRHVTGLSAAASVEPQQN